MQKKQTNMKGPNHEISGACFPWKAIKVVQSCLHNLCAISTQKLPNQYNDPLGAAAAALDPGLVQHFLSLGHPARGMANGKDEPIHYAIRSYKRSPATAALVIKLLTAAGALSTTKQPFQPGYFPPRMTLQRGADDLLSVMLVAERENGRMEELRAAMHHDGIEKLCCELGSIIGLVRLLEEGWDAHSQDEYGSTLVHHACHAAHLPESGVRAVVQVLVDHGNADLSARDSFGRTALQIAKRRGLQSVCELLRRYGADEESYSSLLLRGVGDKMTRSGLHGKECSKRVAEVAESIEAELVCVSCRRSIEPYSAFQAKCQHMFHMQCFNYIAGKSGICIVCEAALAAPPGT